MDETFLNMLRVEMARMIARGDAYPFNDDGTISPIKLDRLAELVAAINHVRMKGE